MSKLFVVPNIKELRAKRHAITIHLSHAQRIAIEELKLIRMAKTKKKPTLRELLTEGLCLLLKKEKIKLEDE